jgi:RNA polymerase sigma-70 factor (ECF subfamily)
MKQPLPPHWLQILASTALVALAVASFRTASADEPSLEAAPPVVVKTIPTAGSTGVDPALTEISVTYSKPMMDGSWSWCLWGEDNEPEDAGALHYLADGRTCVRPVKLQPGKFYAMWLNTDNFNNFKDRSGQPAVPYLLSFETAKPGAGSAGGTVPANDPFANCQILAFGGDRSDDMQSYTGAGPAIRFKPADLAGDVPAGQPLALKGLRLFASRYGSNYSPEETQVKVRVLDSQGAPLADAAFPYAKFDYHAGWVDLVFDKPVLVKQPGKLLTLAFDPQATRDKGLYFHYQKNPPAYHSLVGAVSDGFKPLSDREWLIRACFEPPSRAGK